MLGDTKQYTVPIFGKFIVPKAENDPTLLSKVLIAPCISQILRVLPAVKFDDQFARYGGEVSNVRSDRYLPTELFSSKSPVS